MMPPPTRQPAWPWALLLMAMAWVALSRIPLILNAEAHLDSDLAVEGLTLAEATGGHWRWHYPTATYMGIIPLGLSWPQAMIWGANPITLVSGGTIAYELVVLATFLLARRAFGPRVAAWGLVPLAFSSTGTLWLSGRVYGGHLLAVAWHAGAFALWHGSYTRGGVRRAALLGFWCGLGIYLDKMLTISVAALVPTAIGAWWAAGRSIPAVRCVPAFVLAAVIGYGPHAIGARLDPFDNYNEQFAPIRDPEVLAGHTRLLVLECVPRLIAGHRLPGLQSETENPPGMRPVRTSARREDPAADPLAWATTGVALGLFMVAMMAMVPAPPGPGEVAGAAVRWGLLLSSGAVVAGFIVNRNIFNSDNYRYLVYLLVPWSIGFGLAMDRLARQGRWGKVAAGLAAIALAGLLTLDLAHYYHRYGWIRSDGAPIRRPVDELALAWLREHPEVTLLLGDYWDVYRLSFLTGGRLRGVPYPIYPVRFPEWSRGLPGGHPPFVMVRLNTYPGFGYRQAALRSGGRELFRAGNVAIDSWPVEGGRGRVEPQAGR